MLSWLWGCAGLWSYLAAVSSGLSLSCVSCAVVLPKHSGLWEIERHQDGGENDFWPFLERKSRLSITRGAATPAAVKHETEVERGKEVARIEAQRGASSGGAERISDISPC